MYLFFLLDFSKTEGLLELYAGGISSCKWGETGCFWGKLGLQRVAVGRGCRGSSGVRALNSSEWWEGSGSKINLRWGCVFSS